MKVGIVGAGTIVPSFLEAARKVSGIKVTAICSRPGSREKAEDLAKRYGIPEVYASFDEMLSKASVDTVYVAVPNTLHYELSKRSLLSNKNVILEKPFVAYKEEAVELSELAKTRKLYLFEAITNQYFPNYLKVKELVSKIGELKLVQINYSQYSSRYKNFKNGVIHPVFDPAKAGGALMDLNVYNIHFAVGLFGRPKRVHYYPNMERGIDTSGILVLEYEKMQCVCVAAKDSRSKLTLNIQGDQGYIWSDAATNSFERFFFVDSEGNEEKFALNTVPERLYYELSAFSEIIRNDDYDEMCRRLENTIAVVEVLEKACADAGIRLGASEPV